LIAKLVINLQTDQLFDWESHDKFDVSSRARKKNLYFWKKKIVQKLKLIQTKAFVRAWFVWITIVTELLSR